MANTKRLTNLSVVPGRQTIQIWAWMFHQVQTSHLESRFAPFFLEISVNLKASKFFGQSPVTPVDHGNPKIAVRRGLLVEAILPGGAAEAWNKQQDPGRGLKLDRELRIR